MPTPPINPGSYRTSEALKAHQHKLGQINICSEDDVWDFKYDATQVYDESSGRKNVYRGVYSFPKKKVGADEGAASSNTKQARAIVFTCEEMESFGRECASLANANALGVGPRVYQIVQRPSYYFDSFGDAAENTQSSAPEKAAANEADSKGKAGGVQPLGIIIEEDVGITLESAIFLGEAIPGPVPFRLSDLSDATRARVVAKIKFDVFSQLSNLHSAGVFHRDLRVGNVCVRGYGERPEDVRATLIDFELASDVGKYQLEAAASDDYLDVIFRRSDSFLLPIEIDMGYLAAFCFELDTGRKIKDAADENFYSGKSYPFFRLEGGYKKEDQTISGGTIRIKRITQADLDGLAETVGLVTGEEFAKGVKRERERIVDVLRAADYDEAADYIRSGDSVGISGLIPVNEQGISKLTGVTLGVEDLVQCVRTLVHHGGYLDAKDLINLEEDPEYVILKNRESIALKSYETYKQQIRDQGGKPDYENFYDQHPNDIANALDNVTRYRAKAESHGYRIVQRGFYDERHDEIIHAFEGEELERLAKAEHDRWWDVKREQDYKLGPEKNHEKKTHPCCKPYEELPENEKAKDRRNIQNMPIFLEGVGLLICASKEGR